MKGKLTLDNSSIYVANSFGIYISGNCSVSVKNTGIYYASKAGVYSTASGSGNFKMEGCILKNNYISVNNQGNCNLSLLNTEISDSSNTGILINTTGASDFSAIGCTIKNSGSKGINVNYFGIGSFTFKNNSIINSNGYAFYVSLSGLQSSIFGGITGNTYTNNIYMGKAFDSITLTNSPSVDLQLPKDIYTFEQCEFIIPQNKRLIIDSGAVLKFVNWASKLTVNGEVIAHGTKNEPIVFTSKNDTQSPSYVTEGDYWGGINISGTGKFDGDYIKVKNADSGTDSNINVLGTLILTNSEIINSYNKGINFNTLIQPTLRYNTFRKNTCGVYNARPSEIIINAEYNYWDSIYGPAIRGNSASSGVDYKPWLGTELKCLIHNGESGVYIPTGNYSRAFTDLSLKAQGFDIDISRTYNASKGRQNGSFGNGWSFSYECSIKDYFGLAPFKIVQLPNGSSLTFEKNDNATYTALDSRNRLSMVDGKYVLDTKDQYKYAFNTEGYLTSITDRNGNVFTNVYDNINKKVISTDSNGRETVIWYDSSFYITSSRDAEGKTTNTEYFLDSYGLNNYGEEKSITDRYGKKTQFLRDGKGNITKITNPDNSTRVMTYDTKNNLTSVKDELGKYSYKIYDQNGINLIKEVQPLNGSDPYNGVDDGFAVTSYLYYSEQEINNSAIWPKVSSNRSLIRKVIRPVTHMMYMETIR